MGKVTGFKEFQRELPKYRSVQERTHDYKEIPTDFPEDKLRQQAARCMDCGIPFCHSGCPLGNFIPDWNDLVYKGKWREAWQRLSATNNFPEFTGRLCPAPCEEACVLNIPETPVTIELIEKAIIEKAFENGWVVAEPPAKRTGKKIAVVGSGPSGLAAAQQLNRAGHTVTVFERADKPGGLLRYGIPDFKLEKAVLDRRIKVLADEGLTFTTNAYLGKNIPAEELKKFDAIVLCGGATKPRDLNIPGRELEGIHFAMEYLQQQNEAVAAGEKTTPISAKNKHVIVIGGGDTGSDCVGTARRQGAKSITNFELFPMPTKGRPAHQPWPFWPMRLRSSTSHYEGVERYWRINSLRFNGAEGRLRSLVTATVEFGKGPDGRPRMQPMPFTEHEWPADLVLLAMGFVGPEPNALLAQLGVELDQVGNVKTDGNYRTNLPNVFAAGDMRRGQSLIVWAISEGREAARATDLFLMGHTALPTKGGGDMLRV
ncbi:MAG: glutamate synthase subunit beta [Verrucomicrobia bacterium]|nr:MAG: glutamate synthase subunit beta [Verrucomicrobiota bacterium]